jgi:hypothetical protein
MPTAQMFLLLLATGVGLSGATGYLIFGPLTFRHLRDRNATVGANSFSPTFLGWVLRGGFRKLRDANLNGLATPAQVLLWCCLLGVIGSGLLLTPAALS